MSLLRPGVVKQLTHSLFLTLIVIVFRLLEQIKSPRCKAVVGVLNAAKSKSLRKWRDLDARITDAANEAKDNVKYLYTLDKFFGPLQKCNPVSRAKTVVVKHAVKSRI